jgi:uncharacterized protein (TIGR03083 family)
MQDSLDFESLLRLIDERSTAFRAAIAAAPSLDSVVPTCPDWTLFELAQHLGDGRRAWAATIDAGPDATAKSTVQTAPAALKEREILLSWLAESVQLMLNSLQAAGPARGCWTWWGKSQSAQTCGAVARHQLQEIAVHTYDAQLTIGVPRPIPTEVALDGVEEFLSTISTTTVAWPHQPAAVDYHAVEGGSWRNWLSAQGARLTTPADESPADTVVRGTASQLVLAFYGRIPLDSLTIDGNRQLLDQLVDWDPER